MPGADRARPGSKLTLLDYDSTQLPPGGRIPSQHLFYGGFHRHVRGIEYMRPLCGDERCDGPVGIPVVARFQIHQEVVHVSRVES